MRPTPFQAFVRIMIGCDKFCTYCIVPAIRGPEQSRPPDDIVAEVPPARRRGVQGDHAARPDGQQLQVTTTATAARRGCRDLLARIHDIAGHRADQVHHELPQRHDRRPAPGRPRPAEGGPYLHVPAQSGCDEVLKRMKRLYTVGFYRDMLARCRETVPGVAVSSDFIVGFCGETEESFQKTMRPGRARPGSRTASSSSTARGRAPRPTTCTPTTCPRRSRSGATTTCWRSRTRSAWRTTGAASAETVEVLVEGPSKSARAAAGRRVCAQLTGRTMTDHIVVFDGNDRLIGRTVKVHVTEASPFTLYGGPRRARWPAAIALRPSRQCRGSVAAGVSQALQYRRAPPSHPDAAMPRTDRARPPAKKAPKLSRLQKPADMSLEEWQVELRRQFGREQKFRLENLGDHPAFSDFLVTNPASGNTYRVTVRGTGPATTPAPAPTSPPTPSAPASTSSSPWPGWSAKRDAAGLEGRLPAAEQRGLPAVRGPARDALPARRRVPVGTGPAGRASTSTTAACWSRRPRRSSTSSWPRPGRSTRTSLSATTCSPTWPSCATPRTRRPKVAEAFPRGVRSAAFKDLLKVPLYDYQREGALFAARAGRCLIGDEMGLGKTIQAIAAAEIMARLFGVERVLIVCPTSLKHQWQREIERFTDRPVGVIERPAAQPGRRRSPTRTVLQDHQLRHRPRRPRPDRRLGPGPGHPRRGAADQELDHARRPERQEDRVARTPSS